MERILKITSSIMSVDGQSSRLADMFVAERKARHPNLQVVSRDLGADPAPHLTAEAFHSFIAKPEERTLAQTRSVAFSDLLIDEIRNANTLVIGLPMYNFGVPSALKAYFDHIARAGVTFKYTEKGPVGLLTGKKAYVFATRGGFYAGTPTDTQTAYVRDFLAFIGITDVEFIYAEGLAVGDSSRISALQNAESSIIEMNQRKAA